jgi:hypothetical protein
MIAAALFAGFIIGASAMILVGLYLVARKAKAKPATSFSAIGVGGDSVSDLDAAWVKRILAQIDRQTLTEISKVQ